MKYILFAGDHPRHRAFHSQLIRDFDVAGIVRMKREEHMPAVPAETGDHDAENFKLHFRNRSRIENEYFGMYGDEVFRLKPTHLCTPETLNGSETVEFVRKTGAEAAIIFGTLLLKDNLFEVLPTLKINFHLGLSPWYRGSATLFWPFYNMEPNQAGVTIHEIVAAADAGRIYHQVVPQLAMDDGIHHVACKAIVAGSDAMAMLMKKLDRDGGLKSEEQKHSGRLYLSTSFKPVHLRVNYDLFGDRMSGAFLRKEFDARPVRLIAPNLV